VLTCLLSLAAIAAGVVLLGNGLHIQTNEAMLYWGGACLLILAGVYELHRKIPLLFYQLAKRNPRRKYREETLFFLGQIGRRLQSSGRTMAVVAILLTISLATMFVGLTMGAGYKANMEAYYPYDAGVAIDAPLTQSSMVPVLSFVEERCEVEDSVTYYLYTVPHESIEALSLSDYNHLRKILGLSQVSMNDNEFLVHCDTWNYMDGIRQGLAQQPEITLNGQTLTPAKTSIWTEPMEQYQMAGTKGYVLVLPDKVASQLSGEKIRLAMKLAGGGYPELKNELREFLNSGEWQPNIQPGKELPERVTMGVTVKAWGVANSLTGFTAISFCGLYLSIIFIILSCSVLAFEQLSAIDQNRKNYAVIDRLGVSGRRQVSLIHRELSTVFLIPLFFPILLTILLIAGTQFFFGEAILQEGLILFYGLLTLLIFCAIYLTYFAATAFLFQKIILHSRTL
ncbi:MAG: ABC transporter permease, partial [Blautia massiliensis (ex Durand et al. 2017)]